jgi:hypothetical protein
LFGAPARIQHTIVWTSVAAIGAPPIGICAPLAGARWTSFWTT